MFFVYLMISASVGGAIGFGGCRSRRGGIVVGLGLLLTVGFFGCLAVGSALPGYDGLLYYAFAILIAAPGLVGLGLGAFLARLGSGVAEV
ncbi:hypothetical protein [Tropicibacter sp. S64]|uniref:hypothetical protein n=1 Tax=Tropicibacter sp. S64 TaxID=3415122 RepID=UPI003C7B9E5E